MFPGENSSFRQRGIKIRSLYGAGSFKAAARELLRYKLDVVSVQEVRWGKGVTLRARDYDIFYWKGMKIIILERFLSTPLNKISSEGIMIC